MARHAVSLGLVRRLPLATLVVNIVGSFLLGIILVRLADSAQPVRQAAIGFCGGFTTFSSFAYLTLDLRRRATFGHAAGHIVTSLAGSLAAFAAGGWLAASAS